MRITLSLSGRRGTAVRRAHCIANKGGRSVQQTCNGCAKLTFATADVPWKKAEN